jgi:hypothetical protein
MLLTDIYIYIYIICEARWNLPCLLHVTLLIKDMLFHNILETNNVYLLLKICAMPDSQLLKRNKLCGTEHQTRPQRMRM